MGIVTTRSQRARLPCLPTDVWRAITRHTNYETFRSLRRVSRDLCAGIRSPSMPKPKGYFFVQRRTVMGRQRCVHCSLEWRLHCEEWILQCREEVSEHPYTCRLPPVFWHRSRRRTYMMTRPLSAGGAGGDARKLIVHPTRTNADIHITLGSFSRWSHCLSELNDTTVPLAS